MMEGDSEGNYAAIPNIHIMHIREVVSKNYSPRGNFIKV